MRKFLLFLLLLPAIIVLGHDIYMFAQKPEKGFMLSDTGALWAKYHKESHDKWKINLDKLGKTVGDLNIIEQARPTNSSNTQQIKDTNSYAGSFTQTNKKGEETQISQLKEESLTQTNTSQAQEILGYILEQKALFLFAGLAGIILLMYGLTKLLVREKSEKNELKSYKKKKFKKNKHGYNRK